MQSDIDERPWRVWRPELTSSIITSLIAGVAAAITVSLGFHLWTMFVGWIAFESGRGSLLRGCAAIVALLIGVILAMASYLAMSVLQLSMPILALPLVVALLAFIILCAKFTPLKIISNYFLGVIAFFAANLVPGVAATRAVLSVLLVGAAAAALATVIDRWVSHID